MQRQRDQTKTTCNTFLFLLLFLTLQGASNRFDLHQSVSLMTQRFDAQLQDRFT